MTTMTMGREITCPDCGSVVEAYTGANRHKLGTASCSRCSRRVRLYREPVRTALRVVHGTRAAVEDLRALWGS
jgi:DNA-directed RNA polymerase subunit RPC12/RpoP